MKWLQWQYLGSRSGKAKRLYGTYVRYALYKATLPLLTDKTCKSFRKTLVKDTVKEVKTKKHKESKHGTHSVPYGLRCGGDMGIRINTKSAVIHDIWIHNPICFQLGIQTLALLLCKKFLSRLDKVIKIVNNALPAGFLETAVSRVA